MKLCKAVKRIFRKKFHKSTHRHCLCRGFTVENTGSNTTSGDSDSGSSVYSWISLESHINKNHLDQVLDTLPFYYGSMLDDEESQAQLLAEPGDAFLVSFPLSKNDVENRCTAYQKWHLILLEPNNIICKVKVIYQNNGLQIAAKSGSSLMDFINEWGLNLIERPWNIQPSQLTAKMPIVPQQAFPINADTFPLGSLRQGTLNFDDLRRIPIMEFFVTNCTASRMDLLLLEAERRKRFGSIRIWRLWGICKYETNAVSLILEDIVYGSVTEYVRAGSREYQQLCHFAVQIAEGLRYLEKYSFIHRRITLNMCMLSYDYNIKIAIYGLTKGELFATSDELDNSDHYRWLTPRCLPEPDGPLAPYDTSAMVYSYGMVLWSLFHKAAPPFDGKEESDIKSRQFRSNYILEIDDTFVPTNMKEIILRCWNEDTPLRRFRDLLRMIRKVRDETV